METLRIEQHFELIYTVHYLTYLFIVVVFRNIYL